ncbi:MAG: hypothetical protein HY553_17040 [Elusimicrobia bacterium]|nr:hypothetical protein [Elusimicrobiota bacterium]
MKTLALIVVVAFAQDPAAPSLEQAQPQAGQAAGHAARRVSQRQDLERLKKDVRYVAEELDRELLGPKTNATNSAAALRSRIAGLRARGNLDPRLDPVLAKLEQLYSTMDQREHIDYFVRSFMRAVTDELREAAEQSKDSAALLKRLDDNLDVPVQTEGWLKEDLSVADFKRQGPIKIFIAKHRLRRPKKHVATTAAAVVAGRHHVQIGVEIEGVVTRRKLQVDGDTTFDLGTLHNEVTPEWRLVFGRNMPIPNDGDRVRFKGWTYYDSFHRSEEEFDIADPDMGAERKTLWEIHPVMDVEILPPAPQRR